MNIPSDTSQCRAGETWTLDDEAADLSREVANNLAGGIWSADSDAPHFLGHLSTSDQLMFIAHLKSGRLRKAIGMVANGALRCGVRDGAALLGARRARIKAGRVEFLPQRVPPEMGVLYGSAIASKMPRAAFARLLRKGGNIQIGNMDGPIAFPALSKRDIEEWLTAYPFRSKAGRPKSLR